MSQHPLLWALWAWGRLPAGFLGWFQAFDTLGSAADFVGFFCCCFEVICLYCTNSFCHLSFLFSSLPILHTFHLHFVWLFVGYSLSAWFFRSMCHPCNYDNIFCYFLYPGQAGDVVCKWGGIKPSLGEFSGYYCPQWFVIILPILCFFAPY